jgi:hypothetical protein
MPKPQDHEGLRHPQAHTIPHAVRTARKVRCESGTALQLGRSKVRFPRNYGSTVKVSPVPKAAIRIAFRLDRHGSPDLLAAWPASRLSRRHGSGGSMRRQAAVCSSILSFLREEPSERPVFPCVTSTAIRWQHLIRTTPAVLSRQPTSRALRQTRLHKGSPRIPRGDNKLPHDWAPSSRLRIACLNTSNMTAVDQPDSRTPFIAAIGPRICQRSTGTTSP